MQYTANSSVSSTPIPKVDLKVIKSLAVGFCLSEHLFSPGPFTDFLDFVVSSEFDRSTRFSLPQDRGKLRKFMTSTFKSDLDGYMPPGQHSFIATQTHLAEVSILSHFTCCGH